MGFWEGLKEWLIGPTSNQRTPENHRPGPPHIASLDPSSIVPHLPSSDAIDQAVYESARQLSQISGNLEIPFTPLTEPFELDNLEAWWSARELERSGLSENDYPPDAWEIIAEKFGVQDGLYAAAEVKQQQGDYVGALSSWVRWVSLHLRDNLSIATIEYVTKEQWLLLAKIYAGAKFFDGAQKSLAWAKAAADTEQTPEGKDQRTDEHMKADWKRQFDDVFDEVKKLNA